LYHPKDLQPPNEVHYTILYQKMQALFFQAVIFIFLYFVNIFMTTFLDQTASFLSQFSHTEK
jgi:hypothetical protein